MQTQMRKIGNSMGVILGKKILEQSGINPSAIIVVEVKRGVITITELERKRSVNRDVTTWDAQFKAAKKAGQTSEKSIWGNNTTKAFEKDWTW